jgi:hypothetical protein
MTVVGQLLMAHNRNDPVKNDAMGSFTNPKFAKLYEELVETGSQSLCDAYRAEVQMEEMDIKDVTESLAQVANSIVRSVYHNLLRASQNHLRACSSKS